MTPPVSTVRVRQSPAPAQRLIAVVAVVLGFALLKPWGAGEATSGAPPHREQPPAASNARGGGAGLRASAQPAATATPEPTLGRHQIACAPGGFDLVSIERLATWTVRTWLPIEPVVATGPTDPRIPRVSLGAGDVLALGVCASGGADGGGPAEAVRVRPATVVAAWATDADESPPTGSPLASVPLVALASDGPNRPDLAALYRPVGTVGRWPAGWYTLRVSTGADAGERWIAVGIGIDGGAGG